jgi:transposase
MRGRRLVIDWQEDEVTLWQRYRSEPDPEVRTRWHALWLLRQGHSATETAALVGVHRRSVQRWLSWYRQGGLAAVAQHRQGGRQGRTAYLTAAQQARLEEETARGTIRTVGEAVRWVEQQCGVAYTAWGMRSLLHRLEIRKKVPRPLAAKADLDAQEAWKRGA